MTEPTIVCLSHLKFAGLKTVEEIDPNEYVTSFQSLLEDTSLLMYTFHSQQMVDQPQLNWKSPSTNTNPQVDFRSLTID
jgi:hypothetical protein